MLTAEAEAALASLGLTEKESRALLQRAVIHVLPKDALVVKKGDRNDALHMILEGRVKVFESGSNGAETVLSYHGPGDCFGGIGFDDGPFSATIMTLEPSHLLKLPTGDLKALLSANQLFAARVFESLVRQVEQKSLELSEALQQKAAISGILRAISNSPTNVQSVLDTVAETAARLCDATDTEIFQVEGDEVRLVAKHGQFRAWPIGFSTRIKRNLVIGRAVADRTCVHVHDLQAAETEFAPGAAYAKLYGYRTAFAAPLLREGVAIGAIVIRRLKMQPLTDKQIALLKTFADQAAIALEHVRLISEIREKSRKVQEQAKELAEWNAALETRVAEQYSRNHTEGENGLPVMQLAQPRLPDIDENTGED